MYITKKRIYAEDEVAPEVTEEPGVVEVAPEATDLLFETEDVANLIAEVTNEDVEVEIADDGDSVAFGVGDEVFTVEAEGDEELVEASTKVKKAPAGKKVTASRKVANKRARSKRPVKASTNARRSVRRVRK